ncbi:ATP-binding protein [Luteolibacter sp. LG18]|uniref:AAA family ATPase n=1 Tax=Luteolibacter sp. LG18 TaxID=2819286 RepID=UPI002B30A6AB|nr:shikimate kinase [Luteolibacter sp. LG18]
MPETTRAHLVCGPPAAGKTTYARQLADRLGACLLDSDEVAERLVRAGMALAGLDPNDRDSPAYKQAYRDAVYETLFDLASSNLPRVPVVIAGPFTSEGSNPRWPEQLRERLGAETTVHFVWCPPALRRERIVARGETRDLPKLAAWDAYVATCRDERPVFPHVFVENE